MPSSEPPAQDIPDEVIERFASRLDGFASEGTPRDRAVLRAVLVRAAPPLQRMRWQAADDLLDADDRAVLEAIERDQRTI
jgi:hypothetical protein